ncbi:MAG: hypothetical protein AB1925_12425 [Actinomycetota bacterium]
MADVKRCCGCAAVGLIAGAAAALLGGWALIMFGDDTMMPL